MLNGDDKLDYGENWIYKTSYTVTQTDLDNNGGGDMDIDNTAIATSGALEASASAFVPIIQGGGGRFEDFIITKSAVVQDGSADKAGDVINYTITMQNTGTVTLTSVTVADKVESYTTTPATYVSGDNGNLKLDVGETWTYSSTYTLTQADLDGKGGGDGDLDNTATGNTSEVGPKTAIASVPLVYNPSLTIAKDTSTATVNAAGDVIAYTIDVDNTGNVDLTTVALTDAFADAAPVLVSGDDGDNVLETNETWHYTAQHTVTQAEINAGADLVNVAVIDTDQTAPQDDDATTTIQAGIITGSVLADTNNDNIGDTPIAGVTLTLVNSAGTPVDGDPLTAGIQPITATTAADGSYSFINLAPGTYGVKETQPTGYNSISDKDDGNLNEIRPIAVTAGTANTDNDFVEEKPGIISGRVLADTNNDNTGDTGIAGVILTLFSDPNGDGNPSDGVAIGSPVTTNASGFYSFTNVSPGSYVVVETQPAGYLTVKDGDTTNAGDDAPNSSTTDNAIPVAVTAGETDNGNNFIVELPGSITGKVLADTNNDDIGDTPIAGVTLSLLNSSGFLVDGDPLTAGVQAITTTTSADGSYSFNNLAPGTYGVRETQPTGYNSVSDKDGGNLNEIRPIPVTAGTTNTGNNFVEEKPGIISGKVLADTDNNNSGDTGIGGVTLTLFSDPNGDGNPSDGAAIGSPVTTNASGFYSFTNVSPGNYVVMETQPAGYLTVTDGDTTLPGDDAANSSITDNAIPVAVSAGETDNGNNFIEEQPGSITGKVLADTDNDNTGDTPIEGVILTLVNGAGNPVDGDPLTPGVQLITATTAADGSYSFINLAPGTYGAKETQPAGYNSVSDKDGGNLNEIRPIAVTAGTANTGNDFVEEKPGIISGKVLADTNNDNTGDTGIAGVSLTLFSDPNGDGNPSEGAAIGSPVTTNANGFFNFTNVSPGSYVVVETQPPGYLTVTDGDTILPGDDAANSSTTDNAIPVAVTAGETDNGNNFVEELPNPAMEIIKTVAGVFNANNTLDSDQAADSAGDYINYNINVSNTGNTTLTGIVVTDPKADTGSIQYVSGDTLVNGKLDVGETWTYTARHTVTQAEINGTHIADFNLALPNQVTMSVFSPGTALAPPSYFDTTILSTTGGASLPVGQYNGWCVDNDHHILVNTVHTANVYSSYEPLPAGLVDRPENLDMVNWIINENFVGKNAFDQLGPDAGGNGFGELLGAYTFGDVQRAIWTLIENTNSTDNIGSWSQDKVDEIVAEASAHVTVNDPNVDYVPNCGDKLAVILQPVDSSNTTSAQVTIAEVEVTCKDGSIVNVATADSIETDPVMSNSVTVPIVHNDLLTLDGDPAQSGHAPVLMEDALQFVIDQAISYWAQHGADAGNLALLGETQVQISDLGGKELGLTDAANIITIDDDAAGFGWSSVGLGGEIDPQKVDLLSAVVHEFGHVLGYGHDVLDPNLAVGVRDLPDIDTTAAFNWTNGVTDNQIELIGVQNLQVHDFAA